MNHCCPNAIKESRSERVGLYQNEQRGFACLVDQQGSTAPQTGTLEHSLEQDLSRKDGVDNQYTSICNNRMHEHGMKM